MRSRAERMRLAAEWTAQGIAVLLLAWALGASLRPAQAPEPMRAGGADSAQLAAWTMGSPPGRLHATLAEVPTPVERDWLAAMARSGSAVSWSGDDLVPVAVAVEPVASPDARERVRAAAPAGAWITVRDAGGVLDSARAANGGLVLDARTLVVPVEATPDARRGARAAIGAAIELRPVLVVGSAGWESKFVIAALEESGWRVGARIAVAPGAAVEQGELAPLDTSRWSAVVVLDEPDPALGASIARFVRAGGGAVIAGRAAGAASLRAIAPGATGEYLPADPGAVPSDSAPRRALGVFPVVLRGREALVLERRDALATVAVRRVALGRVLQIGYDDTWRWRMAGGDGAPRAHAEWWSQVVSAVARAPRRMLADDASAPRRELGAAALVSRRSNQTTGAAGPSLDAAPYARLIAALGPASDEPAIVESGAEGPPRWLLPVILLLLIAAWGSRRLRGAR